VDFARQAEAAGGIEKMDGRRALLPDDIREMDHTPPPDGGKKLTEKPVIIGWRIGPGELQEAGGGEIERRPLRGEKYAQELELSHYIRIATGLGLGCGGAVTGHRFHPALGDGLQSPRGVGVTGTGSVNPFSGGMGRREHQVRVAVDKSGHDHAPGSIDFDGAASGVQVLYSTRGTDLHDNAVTYEQGAIRDDAEILQAGAAPRPLVTP